jgi:WD40 repeat protein
MPANTPSVSISPQATLLQFGVSEAVSSAAWFFHESPTLIAGMGFKWLRVFDIRQNSNQSPSSLIATKLVMGLATDPYDSRRFASFGDSTVAVWDMRKTAEPVLTLDTQYKHGLNHIYFSPSRPGYLAAVGKESATLTVWDIKMGTMSSESVRNDNDIQVNSMSNNSARHLDASPSYMVYKSRQVTFESPVLGFSWIPNRSKSLVNLLMTSHAKEILMVKRLPELQLMAWQPAEEITLTRWGTLHSVSVEEPNLITLMKQRAMAGYGLDVCFT